MKILQLMVLVLITQLWLMGVTGTESDQEEGDFYLPTGNCQHVEGCLYKYTVNQFNFDGKEQLNVTFKTDVTVSCESTGRYKMIDCILYCISLNRVFVSVTGMHLYENASSNSSGGTDGGELSDKIFEKKFCFVQLNDGQIAEVIYPEEEDMNIANIKKAIASAFQANFAQEKLRRETDVSGIYNSHYDFLGEGSDTFTRTVTTPDIEELSGVSPEENLLVKSFFKEDSATFNNRVLVQASGHTFLSLDENSDVENMTTLENDGYSEGTYNESFNLGNKFSMGGSYKLVQIHCHQPSEESIAVGANKRSLQHEHNKRMSGLKKHNIMANFKEVTVSKEDIAWLRHSIPSIPIALKQLHKDPTQIKLVNTIKNLLIYESQYDMPSDFSPVMDDLIIYFHQIWSGKKESDFEMRKILYSLLVAVKSIKAQEVLRDALVELRNNYEEYEAKEIETLQINLAFLPGVTRTTVEVLANLIQNNDPLLLVLGSMARYADEIEIKQLIFGKLEKLLNDTKKDEDSFESITNLIYALGNTGVDNTIQTLEPYVQHDNEDIQFAAISSLRMHTSSKKTQEIFEKLLNITNQEQVVEVIVKTLISGKRDHNQNTEEEGSSFNLSLAIVNAALREHNQELYRLVEAYLLEVGTEECWKLILMMRDNALVDPIFEQDIIEHENFTEVRKRRGSDWDEYNSDFDVVASYSSRRSDVITYPSHRAYIYGKRYGVSKVYAAFGIGGFAGIANNGQKYKIFAKVVAKGHAFGWTATAVDIEFLRQRSYNSVYQKIYVKIVGQVLHNEYGSVPLACVGGSKSLGSARINLFSFSYRIFIYVGFLRFYISMDVVLSGTLKYCACERNYAACGSVVPRITLQPSAGASASLAAVVRGGIEISGNFVYEVEPKFCIKVDFQPSLTLSKCLQIYSGWPSSYVDLFAYYQYRRLRWYRWRPSITWSDKKRWNALSTRWDLSSRGRHLTYSSCSASISCGFENGDVQLVNGGSANRGRVEIYYNGAWYTVCDDYWSGYDATVVCRQLGYTGYSSVYSSAYFGQGSGGILLDDLICTSRESNLLKCTHSGLGIHNCGHNEDAGVTCHSSRYSQGAVRLVDGSSSNSGRVEVFYGGAWNTVCDDSWDTKDARVVCRQLGYSGASSAPHSAANGRGTGLIILDDLACTGYESSLLRCRHSGLFVENCSHSEDASAVCY